jgi:hypothetical protein
MFYLGLECVVSLQLLLPALSTTTAPISRTLDIQVFTLVARQSPTQ